MTQISFDQLSQEGQEFMRKVAAQLQKVHQERNELIDLINSAGDYWSENRVKFGSYTTERWAYDATNKMMVKEGEFQREIFPEFEIGNLDINRYYSEKVDTDQSIDVESFWTASDQDC